MLLLRLLLLVLAVIGSEASVGLATQRRELHDFAQHDRGRLRLRQRHLSETLDNLDSLYFCNLTLGTPPQSLRLHIDTGSGDAWCNSPKSHLCRTQLRNCDVSGSYDPSRSTTSEIVNEDFNISYMDGTAALGDYVLDTIGIGGHMIPHLQFGVGTRSTSKEGVLGIGYAMSEVQVQRAQGAPYPNLPQLMVDKGLINSNAYSLWLNDLDAHTGQILFGGVNTDKYHGVLQTVPVLEISGQYEELLIALSGISLGGNDLPWPSPSSPSAVLLDCGTTLMYLPRTVTEALYNQVEAVTDYSAGGTLAFVPCALANSDKTIDFTFSGIKISVPFNEIVLPPAGQGPGRQFVDGTPACVFGIAPAQGTTVLGDTFLRSAYVVYDLANNQISLAQTNFNSTTDNIKEIGVGPGSVPDAKLVPNPISTVTDISRGAARLGAAKPAVTRFKTLVSSANTFRPGNLWSMTATLAGVLVSSAAT